MSSMTNSPGGCCCAFSYLGANATRKVVGVPNTITPDQTWYTNHWRSSPVTNNGIEDAIGMVYDPVTETADLYCFHGGASPVVSSPTGHDAYDCGKWDLSETSDNTYANVTKTLVRSASSIPTYAEVIEMTPDGISDQNYYLVVSAGGGFGASRLTVMEESGATVRSFLSTVASARLTTLDDRGNVYTVISNELRRNNSSVGTPGFQIDMIAWNYPEGVLLIGRTSAFTSTFDRFAYYVDGEFIPLSLVVDNDSTTASFLQLVPNAAKWSPVDSKVHVGVRQVSGVPAAGVFTATPDLDDGVVRVLLVATVADGQDLVGNPVAVPSDDWVV